MKSSVDLIAPPIQEDGSYLLDGLRYGPAEAEWIYGIEEDEEDVTSARISGVERQQNGNTLITVGGRGELIEIDKDKNVVWRYVIPLTGNLPNTQGGVPSINSVFRSYKYPLDYLAFTNNTIFLNGPIENEPNNDFCLLLPVDESAERIQPVQLLGNLIEQELRLYSERALSIHILDINGQIKYTFELQTGEHVLAVPNLASGMYFIRQSEPNSTIFVNEKFIKI